jgi:predicted N-acyltransferase
LKGDLSAALQEEAIIIDGGDTSYSRKRRNVTGVVEKATLLLEDEELKQRAEEFLKAEEEKMKAMKDSLSKPPEK